jgi:hypothetical protein
MSRFALDACEIDRVVERAYHSVVAAGEEEEKEC